jgi:hypothetical protein
MSQRGRPALRLAVSVTRRKPAASKVEVKPTYDWQVIDGRDRRRSDQTLQVLPWADPAPADGNAVEVGEDAGRRPGSHLSV